MLTTSQGRFVRAEAVETGGFSRNGWKRWVVLKLRRAWMALRGMDLDVHKCVIKLRRATLKPSPSSFPRLNPVSIHLHMISKPLHVFNGIQTCHSGQVSLIDNTPWIALASAQTIWPFIVRSQPSNNSLPRCRADTEQPRPCPPP